MKVDLYDSKGAKKGDITLNSEIFEAKINSDLMHRAVVMRLANRRSPIAHTKTRGEVEMTTAKAFKQKGTGRARRGAKSTNIMRGGGVTHGPRNNRNFTKDMPRKEKRAALFSSLTAKANDKEIFALDTFNFSEPKTKNFISILQKLPEAKKYLFVLPAKDEIVRKASSNLQNVKVILANYLNPYDVLHADKICFLEEAFVTLEETFLTKTAK